jgi:hypothetical protein
MNIWNQATVTHISKDGSLESEDGERTLLICHHCRKSADVVTAQAKRHLVDAWPFENLP